ncbi:MAG: helix-turn-helix transcriptional regulator [Gammaproteobacteria bacterium]|jgi:DNA-binding transcriptional ArsR family regulator|nr:helix-turn-helix transcriptional regulator [Gammaproteobacteria bacterium]MBT3723407.1 helix-turn-helix transcriptional regulator [Gammaproteobacteria bacterium]MBT4077648.1 helix-turn-helix transcriptional regulator [Gammaproteobacteria bacterium]MBT4196347.1 helix-turn-helix transcriptional regulator [Gammaproteobacteria bacterium]MBT4452391.1 helix-turn-helix transcriptional regulator [Gammaproteobacteria bacterium]
MKTSQALDAFSALSHETRLTVFKILIKEGEQGLSAGVIAKQLDVQPSTLTAHLHILKRAGLIQSTRQQQKILYSADLQGTRNLLCFLTRECCQGHPEICAELSDSAKVC